MIGATAGPYADQVKFGIKPLLYTLSQDRFAFASEQRALVRSGLVNTSIDPDVARRLMLDAFGSDDAAVADILTGVVTPTGHLPFDLPADMAAVEAQAEDAPHDFARTHMPGFVRLVLGFGEIAGCILLLIPQTAIRGAWLLVAGQSGAMACAGLALLLGGATGNVTDRILHGAVTDFFEVWLGSYRWPAFNVADSAITIGAILLILDLVFFPAKSVERK